MGKEIAIRKNRCDNYLGRRNRLDRNKQFKPDVTYRGNERTDKYKIEYSIGAPFCHASGI